MPVCKEGCKIKGISPISSSPKSFSHYLSMSKLKWLETKNYNFLTPLQLE